MLNGHFFIARLSIAVVKLFQKIGKLFIAFFCDLVVVFMNFAALMFVLVICWFHVTVVLARFVLVALVRILHVSCIVNERSSSSSFNAKQFHLHLLA